METTNKTMKYKTTQEDVEMLKTTLNDQKNRLNKAHKKLKHTPILVLFTLIMFFSLIKNIEFLNSLVYFSLLFTASLTLLLIRDYRLRKTCKIELIMLNYVQHIYEDAKNSLYDCSYMPKGIPSDKILSQGLI